jgi:hypothetical protein
MAFSQFGVPQAEKSEVAPIQENTYLWGPDKPWLPDRESR